MVLFAADVAVGWMLSPPSASLVAFARNLEMKWSYLLCRYCSRSACVLGVHLGGLFLELNFGPLRQES
jgi:hypothetical protein